MPIAAWQTAEVALDQLAAIADRFDAQERPSRTVVITLDLCRKARFAREMMKAAGGAEALKTAARRELS
jgi:hypothetical protein